MFDFLANILCLLWILIEQRNKFSCQLYFSKNEKKSYRSFKWDKNYKFCTFWICLNKNWPNFEKKGKTGGFEEVSRMSELQEKQDHEMVSIGRLVTDARSRLGFILLPLLLLPPPLLLLLPHSLLFSVRGIGTDRWTVQDKERHNIRLTHKQAQTRSGKPRHATHTHRYTQGQPYTHTYCSNLHRSKIHGRDPLVLSRIIESDAG